MKGALITIIIAAVTVVLAVPLTWIGNITTPLIKNWISRRSKESLDRRILKLETELSTLEKVPEITEAEDEILWGIKSLKIFVMSQTGFVVLCLYAGFIYVGGVAGEKLAAVKGFVIGLIGMMAYELLRMRYERDFRWQRSPRYRSALRKSINELKRIQATWGKRIV